MSYGDLKSIDFEVFGHVQGVFFRKAAQDKAIELRIKGYIRNTEGGTVVGTIQGSGENLRRMLYWLAHEGSPMSRIDNCILQNRRAISDFEYPDFSIQ